MFSSFMVNAWAAATVVAVVAGVVGCFTVLRGATFAAHALPNGAFAGAACASLVGASTLAGLGAFSVLGALAIAALGRRARNDVATALVMVLMLGLGSLFLSMTAEYGPSIFALLFGEVLGVSSTQLAPTALLGLACILVVVAMYRPLLLSSVVPDSGEARGVSGRLMDTAFLVVLALTTAVAVPVVGAMLIFTLLITPAATARWFTSRPPTTILLSIAIALVTVWAAIASSYVTNLPVGFFVGSIGALSYAAGRARADVSGRRPGRSPRSRRGAPTR